MTQHSQFALLGKRRFLPFFITQLLGAFNDNIFKQSLILAILYHLSAAATMNKALRMLLAAITRARLSSPVRAWIRAYSGTM